MFNKIFKNKRCGFTLVEILVAAAIFSGFCVGVFSLYRMGSRMFVSGSWKYTRQKEAERFFHIVKERIEQASDIISIGPDPNPNGIATETATATETKNQITRLDTTFVCAKKSDTNNCIKASDVGSVAWLAEWTIGKPDQSRLLPGKKGFIAYNSITLEKNTKVNPALLNMHYNVGTNANDVRIFKALGNFPPDLVSKGLSLSSFNSPGKDFGIAPIPYTYTLEDIASLTAVISYVQISAGTEGSTNTKNPVFSLDVQLQNPKHDKTILNMGFKAKLDCSVNFEEVEGI